MKTYTDISKKFCKPYGEKTWRKLYEGTSNSQKPMIKRKIFKAAKEMQYTIYRGTKKK